MKVCATCKCEFVPSFARQNHCKPCKRIYDREYYLKNKDRMNSFRRPQRDKVRDELRKYVTDYLLAHPCIICGETDIVVLEFDHVDPSTKRANISHMILKHYSLKSVVEEIAKCDVLCANCHRRKTYAQFGWNSKFM